jgi:hypothetical protein
VDAREVSITWDCYALAHEQGQNARAQLADHALRAMVKELQPFVLRISGTGVDGLQLGSPAPYIATPPAAENLTLRDNMRRANVSVADWDQVAAFAVATGADLVLGFNQLLRSWPNDGTHGCAAGPCLWNDSNARAWVQHNRRIPGLRVVGYELGNEPGCYLHTIGLPGAQAAHDFVGLKTMLLEEYGAAASAPKVIGPDVGGCKHSDIFAEILHGIPQLDVATFHHYTLSGGHWAGPPNHPRGWNWTLSDVLAAAASNITQVDVSSYTAVMRSEGLMGSVPLWIGEGATTYSQPLACSFAMLYNYLNILKQGGLNGVELFAAQALPSFFGNSCEHLGGQGAPQGQPTALYWFAVLWKRLCGTQVFRASSPVDSLLLAARSTKGKTNGAGVTLVAANLDDKDPITLALDGNRCEVFLLTPGTTPESGLAKLNGRLLTANKVTGELPALDGEVSTCGAIALPQLGVAFITMQQ